MKKKTCFSAIVLAACTLLLQSCGQNSPHPALKPQDDFLFTIKKNGAVLSDSILQRMVLFYYDENGRQVTDPDDICTTGSGTDLSDTILTSPQAPGYLTSGYISGISAHCGAKTFYLRYPDLDIDTLHVDAVTVDDGQGTLETCGCSTPIRSVQFNGQTVIRTSTSASAQPLYIFEK